MLGLDLTEFGTCDLDLGLTIIICRSGSFYNYTWRRKDIGTGLALHQKEHLVTGATNLEHLVGFENIQGILDLMPG